MLAFLPLSLRILGGRGRLAHMEKAQAQGMLGHSVEKTEVRSITCLSDLDPLVPGRTSMVLQKLVDGG